jgi:hypothetical protein
MAKKSTIPSSNDLVEQLKQSAVAYYSACDNEDFKKQKIEVNRGFAIVEALDRYGIEGRLAMIPLLGDADQGIRVVAAAFLLKVSPDQAIATLKEIRESPTFFERIDAGDFLDLYAAGKWDR